MTGTRTDVEQAKVNTLKVARSLIRLRHSLAADDEINEKLPALEQAFDDAVLNGQLPDEATVRELVAGVLDAD